MGDNSIQTVRKESYNWKKFFAKPEVSVLMGLIAMCVIMSILKPQTFPTSMNIFNVLRHISLTAILAVGMGLVIITRGIDLSVGSVIALASCLGAYVGRNFDAPPIVVLLVILSSGTAFGMMNGIIITKLRLPPFIVTLGGMSIATGIALLITGGSPISHPATWISVFGGGFIGRVPVTVLVMVAIVAAGYIFSKYTQTGRNIYAVGNSEKAAMFTGINVDRTIITTYAITGFLAGVCALILIGQLNSGDPSFGSGHELNVIAAAVIGGISMGGGRGNILGVVVGAGVMGVMRNAFVLLAVPGFLQTIAIGVIIVLAVAIDSIRKMRRPSI